MQSRFIITDGYRPDIDGLRALAILPVVLFHAKVPLVSGGFIGVDVFFVISGYLITSIILRDIDRGEFSIVHFYERRARRILPALFAVLICSCILAALILFPKQYLSFSRSLVSAAAFVSSITFYSESGYFDLDAELKPLLHTWSLSVEELYYVFFPLLMIGLSRFFAGALLQCLFLLTLASFIGATVTVINDPQSNAAFYLPHLRAWELLIGALLAVARPPALGQPLLRNVLSFVGLSMIVVPAVVYSNTTPFPGLTALPPCFGAALLIYVGNNSSTAATRILSHPFFVYFGRISYPLYLWHWPLLVFARFHWDGELSASQAFLVVLVSIGLATVSTYWLEVVFRGQGSKVSRRQIFAFSIVGTVTFLVIGLHGDLTKGWPGRYSKEYQRIFAAARDKDPRQRECLFVRPNPQSCLYGDQATAPTIALWGDSHAAVYADLLGRMAQQSGRSVSVHTFPSCPPTRKWALQSQSWRDGCLEFQATTFRELLESKTIRKVVIAAAFAGYPFETAETGFASSLESTIAALSKAGKSVSLVYPVPTFSKDVPSELARLAEQGRVQETLSISRRTFDASTVRVFAYLDGLARNHNLRKIQPHQSLCSATECYFFRNGTVYYSDTDHLSLAGANQLRSVFQPLFE